MLSARRRWAILLAAATALAGCAAPDATGGPSAAPAASSTQTDHSAARQLSRTEIGPRPGPVQPFRGEVTQEIQVYDGYITARFVLRNTGEEPITFLNTLYDYEPNQLYEPLVRVSWQEGPTALSTRLGRFFPAPAILEPGEEGVYLMGGREANGVGAVGDVITHIKYCPTRGMDDRPALPLEVSQLAWETADGITTVRGVIREVEGVRRASSPTIGIAFSAADGEFVGAVVADSIGSGMNANEARPFEISGPGVAADLIATASGYGWVR